MQHKRKLLTILMIALTSTLLIFTACEKNEDDGSETDEPDNEETVTDIDGNVYSTVQIGDQVWMAENLKTTTYNNGTSIALVTDNTDWENNTAGAFCWYDNDQAAYADTYGALYNWHAVNSGNLCPDGWHVATDAEWKTLEMELGMSQTEAGNNEWRGTNEGSKLAGNATLWKDGALESDSEFGSSSFSALPGGSRSDVGTFNGTEYGGRWWSASEYDTYSASVRKLDYDNTSVYRGSDNKANGFSVRCVKD